MLLALSAVYCWLPGHQWCHGLCFLCEKGEGGGEPCCHLDIVHHPSVIGCHVAGSMPLLNVQKKRGAMLFTWNNEESDDDLC